MYKKTLSLSLSLFLLLGPGLLWAYQQQYIAGHTPNSYRSQQSNSATAYHLKERKIWFEHCLNASRGGQSKRYAMDFCSCGWQHISSGGLPINWLISNNPVQIEKANKRLQQISQSCMVQIMRQRKPAS